MQAVVRTGVVMVPLRSPVKWCKGNPLLVGGAIPMRPCVMPGVTGGGGSTSTVVAVSFIHGHTWQLAGAELGRPLS